MSDGGEQRSSADALRLLDVRSERAYTDRLDHAMLDEPEAVTESEQLALSRRARLDWVERRRRAWVDCARAIDVALTSFSAVIGSDRALQREVHVLRRGCERVSRQLR